MVQTGKINLAFQEPENPWLIFLFGWGFLASLEAEKALMVQMSHSSLSVVIANRVWLFTCYKNAPSHWEGAFSLSCPLKNI